MPERGTQAWLVFAALATTLTGTAGFVFGYGLNRWGDAPPPGSILRGAVSTASLTRGASDDLHTGLIILGPLISSAAAILLPS